MERIDRVLGYDSSPKIIQEETEFNFSIDSTLLSFFMEPKLKTKNIIDLGCGNGIIPLLYSLMFDKRIVGIEIDPLAAERAKRSVLLNNLEDKIEIINDDIKNVKNLFKQQSFSLVVSNPPYFRVLDSKDKNVSETKRAARHETKITFNEICEATKYLLTDKGSFAFVQRCERLVECSSTLTLNRLFPKRIRFVYPMKGKESHIFLMEAVKNGSDHGVVIMEPLYIYNEDMTYTDEIKGYFNYKNEEK